MEQVCNMEEKWVRLFQRISDTCTYKYISKIFKTLEYLKG